MLDGAPEGSQGALTAVAGNVVAMLPLAGMVDLDAERDRLRKEIAAAEAERDRAQAQLGNEAFVSRAPEQVVAVQRQRLATAEEQIALLRAPARGAGCLSWTRHLERAFYERPTVDVARDLLGQVLVSVTSQRAAPPAASSRPRPISAPTIPRRTRLACARGGSRRCGANRASPTSIAPTASTPCSTSSRNRRARLARS